MPRCVCPKALSVTAPPEIRTEPWTPDWVCRLTVSAPPLIWTGTWPEGCPRVISSLLAPVFSVSEVTWRRAALIDVFADPVLRSSRHATVGFRSRRSSNLRLWKKGKLFRWLMTNRPAARQQDEEGRGDIASDPVDGAADDQLQTDHHQDERPQVDDPRQALDRDLAGVDQQGDDAREDQERRPEEAPVAIGVAHRSAAADFDVDGAAGHGDVVAVGRGVETVGLPAARTDPVVARAVGAQLDGPT